MDDPTVPRPPEERGGPLSSRWLAPLIAALLALLIAYGACIGLVALGHRTFPPGDPNAVRRFAQFVPLLEGGGATFYSFQRVPVTLDLQEGSTAQREGEHGSLRVVVSPLGGLLIVGLALVIGGAIAWRASAPHKTLLSVTARMAIVFAIACFGLSFILQALGSPLEAQAFGQTPSTIRYQPSHVGALIWPLVWALMFGSLGAARARHGKAWRAKLLEAIEARAPGWAIALRAAISGLFTGLALVLLSGVLTAIVGTVTHRSETAYILRFGRNVASIAEGVVLGGPHATAAGFVGSMGVPFHYELRNEEERQFATVSIFGGERQRRLPQESLIAPSRNPYARYHVAVPRYALGGLAIAAVTTMLAGFRSARGAGPGMAPAIRSAIMAAALLTITIWLLAYLAGASFRYMLAISPHSELLVEGTIGPSLPAIIALPLLWTVGGGLMGALLSLLTNRSPSRGLEP